MGTGIQRALRIQRGLASHLRDPRLDVCIVGIVVLRGTDEWREFPACCVELLCAGTVCNLGRCNDTFDHVLPVIARGLVINAASPINWIGIHSSSVALLRKNDEARHVREFGREHLVIQAICPGEYRDEDGGHHGKVLNLDAVSLSIHVLEFVDDCGQRRAFPGTDLVLVDTTANDDYSGSANSLFETKEDVLTWMEMKILANVRVLEPTLQQKQRTVQSPAGYNHLLRLDDDLPAHSVTGVGSKVRIPGGPDTLDTAGYSSTTRLVEQDFVYTEAFHERCPCIGRIRQPGLSWPFLSCRVTAHGAVSAVMLSPSSVLGHGLGRIAQFARAFKDSTVAVVVLDEFRVHTHPITDPVQGILKLERCEERQSRIGPLLPDVPLGLE